MLSAFLVKLVRNWVYILTTWDTNTPACVHVTSDPLYEIALIHVPLLAVLLQLFKCYGMIRNCPSDFIPSAIHIVYIDISVL